MTPCTYYISAVKCEGQTSVCPLVTSLETLIVNASSISSYKTIPLDILEPMLSQIQFLGHTLVILCIVTSLTALALFIHFIGHLI